MSCMCGDPCCWSCGPAQGNSRCPICNEWISEGCAHINEESGELKPEFVQLASELIEKENSMWASMAEAVDY